MTRRLAAILFLCLSAILVAAAIKPVTINKRPYYSLKDFAANYKLKYSVKGKDIVLTTSDKRTISFTYNKKECNVFGTVVHLTYPVAKDGKSIYYLSKTDYDTLFYPILHSAKLPKRGIRHIVIDAGHGGKDTGAVNGKIMEKTLTLIVARRVEAILKKRGFKVTMTRSTDKSLELKDRTNVAANAKPDLFISIHFNSAQTTSLRGIETYVPNPADTPSFMGKNGTKAPSNTFDKENALLGFILQRHLIKATKFSDKGLKRVQHYVTRNVNCPAALVELGFISNKDELKAINTNAYFDKVACAICDAIQEYAKLLKPLSVK